MKAFRVFKNKLLVRKIRFFFNAIILLFLFFIIILHSVGLRHFFHSPVNLMNMVMTYRELYHIRYALERYYDDHEDYPSDRDFKNYLYDLDVQKRISLRTDRWGNQYRYLPDIYDDKVVLVSKGPDGIVGTKDDIRLIWQK